MKNFYFAKTNWILLGLSVIFLVIGYVLMMMEFVSISAVVLVLTYLVLIPASLLYRKKNKS